MGGMAGLARESTHEALAPVTEEAMKAFDYTCRYYLNMSGREFLRRLDNGEFKHDPSNTPLARVLAMLPFAR